MKVSEKTAAWSAALASAQFLSNGRETDRGGVPHPNISSTTGNVFSKWPRGLRLCIYDTKSANLHHAVHQATLSVGDPVLIKLPNFARAEKSANRRSMLHSPDRRANYLLHIFTSVQHRLGG